MNSTPTTRRLVAAGRIERQYVAVVLVYADTESKARTLAQGAATWVAGHEARAVSAEVSHVERIPTTAVAS